jgi:hypothetical protein
MPSALLDTGPNLTSQAALAPELLLPLVRIQPD